MADEEKTATEEPAGEPVEKRSKGPAKVIGGIAGMLGLGVAAAIMAVPSRDTVPRFKGVFHHAIFAEKFSANLRDNNQTRFLQMTLDCEYSAYSHDYLPARVGDPLYDPRLRDAVGRVVSDKFLADTYEGPAREAFLTELRDVLDPILFPMHLGDTELPLELDEESGIRLGISYYKSTFRGRFFEHVLAIDAPQKTLQIDGGSVVSFTGGEEDLLVTSEAGDSVFVDVTGIEPEFQGELHIGVKGRLRRLYGDLIAQ
ncbi:MAG: hypothetical protein E2O39_09275 [Planctomycetota bacterium]|nr:MAG: hypothetical protein E2O39_09275 [Planctomycetota bacterium]